MKKMKYHTILAASLLLSACSTSYIPETKVQAPTPAQVSLKIRWPKAVQAIPVTTKIISFQVQAVDGNILQQSRYFKQIDIKRGLANTETINLSLFPDSYMIQVRCYDDSDMVGYTFQYFQVNGPEPIRLMLEIKPYVAEQPVQATPSPSASPSLPQPSGFSLIKPGTFTMGYIGYGASPKPTPYIGESPPPTPLYPEPDYSDNGAQGPISVTLTRPFYAQKTKVTLEQWTSVMGNSLQDTLEAVRLSQNADGNMADLTKDSPALVTWLEALDYANRLSISQGLKPAYKLFRCSYPIDSDAPEPSGDEVPLNSVTSGDLGCVQVVINSYDGSPYSAEGYRLPTEAEWEYMAKGGQDRQFFWGEGSVGNPPRDFKDHVVLTQPWKYPSSVGTKGPNPYGLYDTLGLATEWTFDSSQPYEKYNINGNIDPYYNAAMARFGSSEDLDKYARSRWKPFSRVTRGGSHAFGVSFRFHSSDFDFEDYQYNNAHPIIARSSTELLSVFRNPRIAFQPSFRLVRTATN